MPTTEVPRPPSKAFGPSRPAAITRGTLVPYRMNAEVRSRLPATTAPTRVGSKNFGFPSAKVAEDAFICSFLQIKKIRTGRSQSNLGTPIAAAIGYAPEQENKKWVDHLGRWRRMLAPRPNSVAVHRRLKDVHPIHSLEIARNRKLHQAVSPLNSHYAVVLHNHFRGCLSKVGAQLDQRRAAEPRLLLDFLTLFIRNLQASELFSAHFYRPCSGGNFRQSNSRALSRKNLAICCKTP